MNEGGWRYVCASVPGVAHLAEGTECQDDCASRVLEMADGDSILALAVADGAGSAAESRTGAALACQTLLDECAAHLADPSTADWMPAMAEILFQRVRAALEQRAAEANRPLRAFACTLLGAVVAADRALFLQIGDGAIVVGGPAGYRPVFWPQGGEYANETYFVTDSNAVTRLECVVLNEPIAEIALLSDGLQRLALHYQTRQAHIPFFRPLFQHLRDYPAAGCPTELAAALERFLASPAIDQRTHDDKTLILAIRLPVAADAADAADSILPIPTPTVPAENSPADLQPDPEPADAAALPDDPAPLASAD